MFTQQTLVTLNILHSLLADSQNLRMHLLQSLEGSRDCLLSTETREQMGNSVGAMLSLSRRLLVEAVERAGVGFIGTPFEQDVANIAAGFKSEDESAHNSASLALYMLTRNAGDWLRREEDKRLPLIDYRVANALGADIMVKAVNPHRARVAAAEQHYGCTMAEIDGDCLRAFGLGVPV